MDTRSMDLDLDSSSKNYDDRPTPKDIEAFIPWACGQLQMPCMVLVNKIKLSEPTRMNTTRGNELTNMDAQSAVNLSVTESMSTAVFIDAIYDNSDELIQLKFNQNSCIPVKLLKLLTLIVRFYPYLTAIYINKGLNQSGLYQLTKVVGASNLTEVILDNTVITEANYYILLDNNSPLKYLSLAKCMLNDTAAMLLISKLIYPSKASKTLSVLNLSSNRLTDDSAKYLGDMLRMNRRLVYLNLSGNMISDAGANSILSSLITFPLSTDEITGKKERKFTYINEKNKFVKQTVENIRIELEKKYAAKKKSGRPVAAITKKVKSIEASPGFELIGISGFDTSLLKKTEIDAEVRFGPFNDPYSYENTVARDGVLYCYGNNSLCYLNLAYNNLTYFSLKKLHEVICIQHGLNRNPSGLINVCIEGNNLPNSCKELAEIDELLDSCLTRLNVASDVVKKKDKERKH